MILCGAALIGFVGQNWLSYQRDIAAARRDAVKGSQVLMTARGPIEYADRGIGDAVLALHGTGGGWDQALFVTGDLAEHGFRLIAPSRFGYLRTPLASELTAQNEADTWVTLLDSLKIQGVSVIGISASAAQAVQFALRHPERTSALILIVPGPGGLLLQSANKPPEWVLKVMLKYDFPMWATMKFSPKTLYRLAAVPPALVPTLTPKDREDLWRGIRLMQPISQRYRGILYDASTQSGTEIYPVEKITVPTLLVSAEDDLYQTLRVARSVASRIPNAKLVEFPTGGHFLLGHKDEIWPRVADFIHRASLAPTKIAKR